MRMLRSISVADYSCVHPLDHTEEIAVRVLEDDEVGTHAIAPGISAGAERLETRDLRPLVVGIEVQMDPVAAAPLCVTGLKRQVRRIPARIA